MWVYSSTLSITAPYSQNFWSSVAAGSNEEMFRRTNLPMSKLFQVIAFLSDLSGESDVTLAGLKSVGLAAFLSNDENTPPKVEGLAVEFLKARFTVGLLESAVFLPAVKVMFLL
jgi:hypothetical protein